MKNNDFDLFLANNYPQRSIPVAERSKAWVWGRSLAGISGSNPAWGVDYCLLCVVT